MKALAIHQPEFMPYVGFFNKMVHADEFVILDDVQFKKNNYQNRNKILLNGQEKWLTVPVKLRGHLSSTIRDISIETNSNWDERVLNLLYQAYHRCPNFKEEYREIRSILESCDGRIFTLNMDFISYIRNVILGIETDLILSSELGIDSSKSDLVLDICKARGADIYLSGTGGRTYLDTEKFKEAGVTILYPERFDDYNLSIVDLLMREDSDYIRKYVRDFAIYKED